MEEPKEKGTENGLKKGAKYAFKELGSALLRSFIVAGMILAVITVVLFATGLIKWDDIRFAQERQKFKREAEQWRKEVRQKAKEKEKRKQEQWDSAPSVEQWIESYMPDAELIGTPGEYKIREDNKSMACKALQGTMRHNGRGFSYVFDPLSFQMYSDEYRSTFDTELGEWFHSSLFYAPEGSEPYHFNVTYRKYMSKMANSYDWTVNLKLKGTHPLFVESMHPATMAEDRIGDWIRGNLYKSYRITEKLTLNGCKDLSEIAIITDETEAGTAGIDIRICARLCDDSQIVLYNEAETSYIRLITKGSSVEVSYWTVDRSHQPSTSGWFKQKTETYQID